MTEWYEKPYPGGPMVAVAGFPRPLYPPDAAPKYTPSDDGDDVEGIKRTVSRAGRWPWQAFTDEFSNQFSHGKSGGNVGDSGIAGVQRQANIEPTGFVGEQTFNLLRSIKIPEGLPHAGEMAMDANAATLISQEYHKRHTPPPPSTVREAALSEAIKHIGVKESPAGSNQCMFTSWYGFVGPWCAMFATYCYENGKKGGSPSFEKGSYYAYVPYILGDARNGRRGLSITTSPIPGDLVCYDWGRDGTWDHIGIFEKGTSFSWTAIEGNTSSSNNSNGGEVQRRNRAAGDANTIFVRVKEPT